MLGAEKSPSQRDSWQTHVIQYLPTMDLYETLENQRLRLMMVWSRWGKAHSQLSPIWYEGFPFPEPENSWHPCRKHNCPGPSQTPCVGDQGYGLSKAPGASTVSTAWGNLCFISFTLCCFKNSFMDVQMRFKKKKKKPTSKVCNSVRSHTCMYPEKHQRN